MVRKRSNNGMASNDATKKKAWDGRQAWAGTGGTGFVYDRSSEHREAEMDKCTCIVLVHLTGARDQGSALGQLLGQL